MVTVTKKRDLVWVRRLSLAGVVVVLAVIGALLITRPWRPRGSAP